jgi:sugar phosphate permease
VSLDLVTTGFAMGGAIVLPALAWVDSAFGWQQVMFVSGIAVLVLHSLGSLLVADRLRDLGLRPKGALPQVAGEVDVDAVEGGFSSPEALRSPVFWLVALGMMLFFLG